MRVWEIRTDVLSKHSVIGEVWLYRRWYSHSSSSSWVSLFNVWSSSRFVWFDVRTVDILMMFGWSNQTFILKLLALNINRVKRTSVNLFWFSFDSRSALSMYEIIFLDILAFLISVKSLLLAILINLTINLASWFVSWALLMESWVRVRYLGVGWFPFTVETTLVVLT